MKRIGGSRRKSRYKLKLSVSEKGKLPLTKYLQEFDNGQKVLLKAFSSHQGGMFNLRFHGRIGEVIGRQGTCFKVLVKDGKKMKEFVVHPVHLIRA